HPHIESPDQDRVADNIHKVGDDGDDHRSSGIILGTEKGSARIVETDEGEGEKREEKVDLGITHNRFLHGTESQAQQRRLKDKAEEGEQGGKGGGDEKNLRCGAVRFLLIAVSQILGAQDCAPGGQSGKRLNDQNVDGVYQGYGGDRG